MTGLTVALAARAEEPRTAALVGALFAALLCGFFVALGRRYPDLRSLPFRLIESGFLVVTLGATAAALDHWIAGPATSGHLWAALVHACGQRLGLPILGLSLVGFGIVLWVPLLVDAQRRTREQYRTARVELRSSERERARMESRIVEADRLRTTGQLAVGVAHDLRNPLAICRAAAESLARKASSGSDASGMQEHAEVIRRNVDRAERTIAALLSLGRTPSDGDRREPTGQPQEIAALLGSVVGLVSVEAERSGARIQVDAQPIVAAIDTESCHRLLLNLIRNALQAGAEHIRVGARVWTGRTHAPQLALTVSDRGHGLPTDLRDRVFEPFFTTREDGIGLGLLSCRRISSDLGGTIRLYPRHRGGCRAVVLLPLDPRPAEVETTIGTVPG